MSLRVNFYKDNADKVVVALNPCPCLQQNFKSYHDRISSEVNVRNYSPARLEIEATKLTNANLPYQASINLVYAKIKMIAKDVFPTETVLWLYDKSLENLQSWKRTYPDNQVLQGDLKQLETNLKADLKEQTTKTYLEENCFCIDDNDDAPSAEVRGKCHLQKYWVLRDIRKYVPGQLSYVSYLIYRIWNFVKAFIGQSDWQITRRDLNKKVSPGSPKEVVERVVDDYMNKLFMKISKKERV